MFPAAWLVGLLAACSSFSSDSPDVAEAGATEGGSMTDTSPASTDGGTSEGATEGDAGGLGCATRTDAPLMCAHFDDAVGPRVYSEGLPSNVQPFTNRVVMAPGKSAPNALWFDARTSSATALTVTGGTTATRVRVALDVFVDPYAMEKVDGALVRVGISPDQCYVEVRLLPGSLLLQTHCVYTDEAGDYYRFQEILPNPIVSSQWVRVELDVDYATVRATASLDGNVRPTLALNPSAKPGGKPYVDVGTGLAKVRVGFDNILAIASK